MPIGCYKFMSYASRLRWKEVSDFYPVDNEIKPANRELSQIKQDESYTVNGTCGKNPCEALCEQEIEGYDLYVEKLVRKDGMSLKQALIWRDTILGLYAVSKKTEAHKALVKKQYIEWLISGSKGEKLSPLNGIPLISKEIRTHINKEWKKNHL